MAGMEDIEIHSKSYLVRWVSVKSEHSISWTIQPHKRSINFGIFKHPDHIAGVASSSPVAAVPPSPNPNAYDEESNEASPAVVDKLISIGLKPVVKLGKCEADKVTQGKYEVPAGEAGNYALVFDNTFSKNISKTATIFLLTYPTACQSKIQFGAQIHHSQAMASAMSLAPPTTGKRSPKLKAKGAVSADSLRRVSSSQAQSPGTGIPSVPESTRLGDESSSIHTGILQKRRRKKHQGYARRFFCLDFTSSTLSYYHDRNSSALRGAIPLSLAAIGANAKSREISIDSGAEIWHLKANNKADFDAWKGALQKASRLMVEAKGLGNRLSLDMASSVPFSGMHGADDQEWARLEALLSRISGSRDAVRRLCLDTLSRPVPSPSPGYESGPSTPTEGGSEDYFKPEERRPFWKRKPSSTSSPSNMFKRSVSAQLAVPGSAADPFQLNGSSIPATPVSTRGHHRQLGEDMHDHCRALLHDLDVVVNEFSALVSDSKQRRLPIPKSAVSRMSIQSIESQEFFDAEDTGTLTLLAIQNDSDDDDKSDADSATSSDIDDGSYLASNRAFRSGSLTSLLPPKAKSLTPLPHNTVERRQIIPPPTIMPPSLIGFLRKNVGKDLSTITMPVSANEPTSLLQRAAEQLEYSELLGHASKTSDPMMRLIYVAAFAISSLSSTRVKERSLRKPFNPMLGETYELVREDCNFRFLAEKVSHRPVQLAFHAESAAWSFTQSPLPSQKFWGKSSEIITEGKARLVLHGAGECISWNAATCFLRNIIAGEKYVEPVGTMTVQNEISGAKAVVTFKAKGMFSGRSEDVEVHTFDADGAKHTLGLVGTWTQSLHLSDHGTPSQSAVWTAGSLVHHAPKHYGMTAFAAALNEVTSLEAGKLPPTDSRLRPDQLALEDGDHESAETLKNGLEEAQRARRKVMEANNEAWKPRWFTRIEHGDEVVWKLKVGKEGYWEERAKGGWTGVVDVMKA